MDFMADLKNVTPVTDPLNPLNPLKPLKPLNPLDPLNPENVPLNPDVPETAPSPSLTCINDPAATIVAGEAVVRFCAHIRDNMPPPPGATVMVPWV
jgi:hypothetical protein